MRFERAAGPRHSRRNENEPVTSPRTLSGRALARVRPMRAVKLVYTLLAYQSGDLALAGLFFRRRIVA
jgi:hypothetical protein